MFSKNNNYDGGYSPKKKNSSLFLFIASDGVTFHCSALEVDGHTLLSVVDVYRNMHRNRTPVAVLRVSKLEAYLLTTNFYSWKITPSDYSSTYESLRAKDSIITKVGSNGYTSVFLDNVEGQFSSTTVNTGYFLGFTPNQYYLPLINNLFHANNNERSTGGDSVRNPSFDGF